MNALVEILKSRGKLGAWGLIVLGVAGMVLTALGKANFGYSESGTALALGLSLLGIRSKQG